MTNLAEFHALFQDLRYPLFDMDPILHMHILIVIFTLCLSLLPTTIVVITVDVLMRCTMSSCIHVSCREKTVMVVENALYKDNE